MSTPSSSSGVGGAVAWLTFFAGLGLGIAVMAFLAARGLGKDVATGFGSAFGYGLSGGLALAIGVAVINKLIAWIDYIRTVSARADTNEPH